MENGLSENAIDQMDKSKERIPENPYLEPPTEVLCPNIKIDAILQHLWTKYGLKVTQHTRLNGYMDFNLHIMVDREHSNPNIDQVASNGYFVKVSNIVESEDPEILEAQLAAMKHLLGKGLPCQSSVRSVDNKDFTDIQVTNKTGKERTHKVSVRTFLPGRVAGEATLTPSLLYNIGLNVAKVSIALEDFYHPFYDSFDHLWSMGHIPKVAKVMFAVTDKNRRRICEDVLKAFDGEAIPQQPNFRKGQIHGDMNEQNILVNEVEGQPTNVQLCGLLDFQHCALSHPVYDLALNAAYMMMVVSTEVPRNQIPGYVMAGYKSLLNLNQAEEKVFHTLVASRMVQSLVYGAYNYHLDPSNEYFLDTARCGWNALVGFWAAPRETVEQDWRNILESYEPPPGMGLKI